MAHPFSWSQAVGQALRPCRFSIGILVLGVLVFLFPDQTPEALITLTQRNEALAALCFAAGVVAWGQTSWYFARVLCRFEYPDRTRLDERPRIFERAVVEWAPRVLGVAPMVVVVLALARCAGRTRSVLPLAVVVALSGVVFGTFVVVRRRLLEALRRALDKSAKSPLVRSLWEDLDAFRTPSKHAFRELPLATRVAVWIHLGVFVFFVLIFAGSPVEASRWLGAPTILVLALATWIVAGSLVAYLGSWIRMPLFLFIAAYAVLVSPYTDDHVAKPMSGATDPPRPAVRDDFSTWRSETGARRGTPFVIVATEGGGIRAAYWTAAMLAALQDTNPAFASRVYAISSVSGGSVGAAVFDAVVRAKPANHRNAAGDILSADSLAPPLARMLFPDLLQRLVFVALPGADRGEALERSWTTAVSETLPTSRFFERRLADAFRDDAPTPRLFLNSTWVETGKRVVFSGPRVEPQTFPDAVDGDSLVSLSVADAVLASARFPYVSPALTVPDARTGETWGHLVDGGYFENSGAETAAEILSAIGNREDARVVVLRYDDGKPTDPTRWVTEVTSPPYALLRARGARESLAIAALRRQVPSWAVAEIVLTDVRSRLPLGWMLSADARTDINYRVDEALRPGGEGAKILDWLSERPTGSAAGSSPAPEQDEATARRR